MTEHYAQVHITVWQPLIFTDNSSYRIYHFLVPAKNEVMTINTDVHLK